MLRKFNNKLLSRIAHKIMPRSLLKFLFPQKFAQANFYNRFIVIRDIISQKSFQMYLRDDSYMENVILSKGLYGDWERESLKIWAELSKKSQIVIDIGANTGIYSLLAQNNNPKAKIIAIEPVDINFGVLSKNIKQNRFPINAEKVALSDKEGFAKMYMLKDRLNYMTSVNDDRYALHPEIKGNLEVVEIEVPIKPYSYIHQKYNLNDINLIKIDVEGHEITIIREMQTYLEKYKPSILIEIIGDDSANELDKIFGKIGYKFVSIDEINKSVVVDKLWDNDHHNFLICNKNTIQYLQSKNLVV
jgi:FkbM family methyltransferase